LNITDVRIKLMHRRSDRLRAFASITIDGDFVVHDMRIIEGRNGYFVAMPSRKLSDTCPHCGGRNELRAKYCGNCGSPLDPGRLAKVRDKLHVDVAHPINTACRQKLQKAVLDAYREEERKAAGRAASEREADAEEVELPEAALDVDEFIDEGLSDTHDGSLVEGDSARPAAPEADAAGQEPSPRAEGPETETGEQASGGPTPETGVPPRVARRRSERRREESDFGAGIF